jgi:hypothetical protein
MTSTALITRPKADVTKRRHELKLARIKAETERTDKYNEIGVEALRTFKELTLGGMDMTAKVFTQAAANDYFWLVAGFAIPYWLVRKGKLDQVTAGLITGAIETKVAISTLGGGGGLMSLLKGII